jgi:hypothetical protein
MRGKHVMTEEDVTICSRFSYYTTNRDEKELLCRLDEHLLYALTYGIPNMYQDVTFKYAIDKAATNGHVLILEWFVQELGWVFDKWVSFYAAQNARLNVLIWLHKRGYVLDKQEAIQQAASIGSVSTVTWLVENTDCVLKAQTFSHFSQRGNITMLKWLKYVKCPWNYWTTVHAAGNGHLEALQWLVENGCPFKVENCLKVARKYYNVTEWLNRHWCINNK